MKAIILARVSDEWQPILSIFLIYVVFEAVMQMSANAVVDSSILSLLVMIVSVVLGLILQTGMITAGLKVVRDVKPEIADLFGSVNKVANYFMVSLVYGLIVMAGMILLVVPGIYFAIKYGFMTILAVDKKLGPGAAMKASAAMTEGIKFKLLVVYLVLALFSAVGFLALGFGALLTVPTAMIAMYLIYQRLLSRTTTTA